MWWRTSWFQARRPLPAGLRLVLMEFPDGCRLVIFTCSSGCYCCVLATSLFIPSTPSTLAKPTFATARHRCQVMDEGRQTMLAVATSLYDLLQHLAELGPPARTVQRAYRSHAGRSLLALSRHEVRVRREKLLFVFESHILGVFLRAFGGKRGKGSVPKRTSCTEVLERARVSVRYWRKRHQSFYRIPNLTDSANVSPATFAVSMLKTGDVRGIMLDCSGSCPFPHLLSSAPLFLILHGQTVIKSASLLLMLSGQLTCPSPTFACAKQQLALKRHNDRYMWERGTNHVKAEWERARKLEAEEKQRQYEEWLRLEVPLSTLLSVFSRFRRLWQFSSTRESRKSVLLSHRRR